MNKYEVIDDYLDKDDFLKIKNIFFPKNDKQKKLPWNYQIGIVRNPELGPTGYEEHDWMYSHSFLETETKKESEFMDLIFPIFKKLNASEILDARANLLVPTDYPIQHEYHVDRKMPHQVALFYITTNNGFTILKDTAKIDCIENRMLIFDGSLYHTSVTSTDDVRCAVNINYVPYKKFENLNFVYQ